MSESQEKAYNSCLITAKNPLDSQVWMSGNLNVAEYCNGDKIIESKSMTEWVELNKNETGGWCYYENNSSYGTKYGKLYNWYAVNDNRGLAPEGWKIPSDEDWKKLEHNLGMNKENLQHKGYRGKEGNLLKSKKGWESIHKDEFGFNALPGGGLYYNGQFDHLNLGIGWWCSVEYDKIDAWRRNISILNGEINRNIANKGNGFYIRCIKD